MQSDADGSIFFIYLLSSKIATIQFLIDQNSKDSKRIKNRLNALVRSDPLMKQL